ncbi:protein TolQ [Sphingomicrobium nitratireducens]|uniref:protein TolQ n=1 Tax=Sphingomicrobium nitratireducens TaxID=2964666 RepID=UPI00223E92F2|nr:protein TolQ [Sphingomicrobium nitratireducens]
MPEVTTSGDLMSPLTLFLQADLVVKIVMLGLLAASIWTWGIIFTHSARLRSVGSKSRRFIDDFARSDDLLAFYEKRGREDLPPAKILKAGLEEFRRPRGNHVDRAALRERIAIATDGAIAGALDRLSDRLNILATVGSVAPFVGLFGTVWGIMRSFTAIAGANNTSLAVVAPGIAEALFATAIGLFAAIPAVIAYNRLTHRIDLYEAQLGRFADRFQATLGRELERA